MKRTIASSFIASALLLSIVACKEDDPRPPVGDTSSSSGSVGGSSSTSSASSGGGSSSSSSSGGGGTECKLDATFSGGFSGKIDVNSCSAGINTFSISNVDLFGGTGNLLSFTLGKTLKDSDLGVVPISATKFTVRLGKDADGGFNEEVWSAGDGVCTIKLLNREPRPSGSFGTTYASGEGSCTGALTAVAPNTKEPVTISAFTFRSLVPSDP